MRTACKLLCLALAGLLYGCPGALLAPLPPGSGPGDYAGQLTADEGDAVVGSFELTIADSGEVLGTGIVEGRTVRISGVFAADSLDGLITDAESQLSGRFDGTLVGGILAGDFRLPRLDGDDLTGLWDAAPQ